MVFTSYVTTGVPHAYNWLFNIFFFLAALFSDVLLIKSCLAAGFMWMVIVAATGNPQWGDGWASSSETRVLILDMLCWGVLGFVMNGIVVVLLLRDERPVHFKTKEEERTWRFFYRRSGMKRLEFEQVVRRGEFVTIKAGESIIGLHEHLQSFFLLIDGVAELEVSHESNQEPTKRRIFSGTLFDLAVANVFGVRVGLLSQTHFAATAVTDSRLLKWSFEMMEEMATKLAPCIPAFWRNMLLYQVSQQLFSRTAHSPPHFSPMSCKFAHDLCPRNLRLARRNAMGGLWALAGRLISTRRSPMPNRARSPSSSGSGSRCTRFRILASGTTDSGRQASRRARGCSC